MARGRLKALRSRTATLNILRGSLDVESLCQVSQGVPTRITMYPLIAQITIDHGGRSGIEQKMQDLPGRLELPLQFPTGSL